MLNAARTGEDKRYENASRGSVGSAEQDDPARQRTCLGPEQLLNLEHEVPELADLERAVDDTTLQIRIRDDDLAGSIAIDLIHHIRERLVAKDQQPGLPSLHLHRIDR